ncbi:MAG: RNA polymerase sigma factor [Agarilytica sp.]
MDEPALIKAAQAGDEQAFEQLLEYRYDTIYRFAYKWCANKSDAEDITQQACIKLAKGLKQYKYEAAFSTWLYRLVINCAKDWQRQQQRHVHESEPGSEEHAVSAGHATESHKGDLAIYLNQLLAWIALLGEEFKETILLVFGEGLSHGEAAKILQIKESTVSWRIHNVRKKLAEFDPAKGGPP